MRVRVPPLLQDPVYPARFVEIPDALAPGTMQFVLEVASDPPLKLESSSADDVEVVEATAAEWAELERHGFGAAKRV